MAKKRIFDLPETKGQIKIRGFVTGTKKDKFHEQTTSQNGDLYNKVKFGVQVSKDSTVYTELSEKKMPSAYFYKKPAEKGAKGTTKEVPFDSWKTFKEDGFSVIGMKNALERELNEKGELKNKTVTMPNYAAVDYIAEKLEDEMPVLILGEVDYSSFTNKEGDIIRSKKFVPKNIYLSSDLDFDKEDFKQMSDFSQNIIFMSIDKDSEATTDRFILGAKIVKYSTIEDVEFIIENKKLALKIKKNLKPYTALEVWGVINCETETETVEVEDDGWGDSNPFEQKFKSYKRELVITGVNPESFDVETYTKDKVEEAMKAIENNKKAKSDFGDSDDDDDWGEELGSSAEVVDIDDWD